MENENYTIGGVSRLAGVGVETIRFYERKGLIPNPPRRESGYRQYPPDTIHRVHFIKKAKTLGFTLAEIKGLLSLRIDRKKNCEAVKRKADQKIREVETKINDLQRIKKALKKLTVRCRGKGPISTCPILEDLESKGG